MFEVDTGTSSDHYDFIKWFYEDRIRYIEYVLAQSARQNDDNKLPIEEQMELEKELKEIKEHIKYHNMTQDF
jgi:hypothetical protein